jgi:hypothetical protein
MSLDRDLMDRLVQVVAELSEQGGEAERSRFYTGLIVLRNSGSATPTPAGFVQVRFEGVGQLARYFGNEPAVGDYVDVLMVYEQTPIIIQSHTGGLTGPGWPFHTEVATVDTTDPDADYTTIALAIAGGGKNTIVMSPETHVCHAQTLNAGENLRGMDLEASVLQSTTNNTCLAGGDGCHIMDITLENVRDVLGTTSALHIDSNVTTMELWRVRCVADNGTAGGTAYGILIDDDAGTIKLWNCYATASADGAHGLLIVSDVAAGPTVYIYGGYYAGDDYDLNLGNYCTVYLYGPTLGNGTINYGTGVTLQGWWYEADGSLRCAGDVDIGSTTDSEKAGTFYQAVNHDVRMNDDRYGLARRLFNPLGLTTWTSHFRTGDVAGAGELAGFAWQGAPFVGTLSLDYSWLGEYLVGRANAGAGARSYMAKAITNAAASWQDKGIWCRFNTGITTHSWIRFDSNDDNNYVVLQATSLGDATFRIDFIYRDAGGAINTITSNLIIPAKSFCEVFLFCDWTGVVYNAVGLLVSEFNTNVNITGFLHLLTGNWAAGPPAVGRWGLGWTNNGNVGAFDWFYGTFT